MWLVSILRLLVVVLIPLGIVCCFIAVAAYWYVKVYGNPFAVRNQTAPIVDPIIVGAPAPQPTEKFQVIDKNSAEWSTLCLLLRVPDPHNLGVGRDVNPKESNDRECHVPCKQTYSSLRPVHAWKITSPEARNVYNANKSKVQTDLASLRQSNVNHPDISTKLDVAARNLGVDFAATESVLLHGTTPDHVLSILHHGLNERLSGGAFGEGVYLAEDPAKIDQYCVPDTGAESLMDTLYKGGFRHEGEVCYCLVVRALLGMPVFTIDGEHDMHMPSQGVFANPDKRELACVAGSKTPVPYHTLVVEVGDAVKRHREFVIFNGARTCVEYLVAFVRE